jgi:hypothetical protein
MTRVDHHAHHKLVSSWQPSSQYHMRLREAKGAINVTWCPHGGLRRSIICYYTNAKRGDPRRKLDMPLDGYAQGSHQRCAWQTLRRCRLQHICEHSGQVLVPVELAYPPQLARNSSCIDHHHWSRSREESLAFYRRDVVCHHNAIQRPTSRSSKLVSRRATLSLTRKL